MGEAIPSSVVLIGFESAGKTALFRGLTGEAAGDETNFRGSTVMCRKGRLMGSNLDVVDTPGIRARSDSETTRMALEAARDSDTILLVARGTDIESEVTGLLGEATPEGHRTALAVTFADKAPAEVERLAAHYGRELAVPFVAIDAREITDHTRESLLRAIKGATRPATCEPAAPPRAASLPKPQITLFENTRLGPWAALLTISMMFGVPVWAAYKLAAWLQPHFDTFLIEPSKTALAPHLPSLAAAIVTGPYGLLTLGWYSFLWAFPVVLFIGIGMALAEETGLSDRMTRALDPWLRHAGLSGRDLLPVLTGFGCNVVAVFKTRSCSQCSRPRCTAMIAFGSACSYQIGAALSLFGTSGHENLFLPYLSVLFLAGAVHARLAFPRREASVMESISVHAFLGPPSARAIGWRVKAVVKQFLSQAMPMFLTICAVSAILAHFGVMDALSRAASPLLRAFRLPPEAAPGVIFSILRKDGLLTLNQDEGAFLRTLSSLQVFTLVWLGSTLSACSVTLYAVWRELGWKVTAGLAGKQLLASAISTLVIAWAGFALF